MPFASLRRRTITEPQESKGGQTASTPSARSRAITLPSLSSRKSFSSLLGYSNQNRGASASPVDSRRDVLEQDLQSEDDLGGTGLDSERVGRSPSSSPSDKPKRFHRSPSPHPLKRSMSSRFFRLSHKASVKGRLAPSPPDPSPSKTFLESLADAIRAPATLFYKEKKDDSPKGKEEVKVLGIPQSRAKSTSPKKSVRFRSGNSIIGNESRSSPIDIPKPAPSLPPVNIATTPLPQFFGRMRPDFIPTARPSDPPVLTSSAEFREALTEAEKSISLQASTIEALSTHSPDLQSTPSASRLPSEYIVNGQDSEPGPETRRSLLREYDSTLLTRATPSQKSSDIIVEKNFVANDEKVSMVGDENGVGVASSVETASPSVEARGDAEIDNSKTSLRASGTVGTPEELAIASQQVLKSSTTSSGVSQAHSAPFSDLSGVQTKASPQNVFQPESTNDSTPMVEEHRLRAANHQAQPVSNPCISPQARFTEHGVATKQDQTVKLPENASDASPLAADEVDAVSNVLDGRLIPEQGSCSSTFVPKDPPWTADLVLRGDRPSVSMLLRPSLTVDTTVTSQKSFDASVDEDEDAVTEAGMPSLMLALTKDVSSANSSDRPSQKVKGNPTVDDLSIDASSSQDSKGVSLNLSPHESVETTPPDGLYSQGAFLKQSIQQPDLRQAWTPLTIRDKRGTWRRRFLAAARNQNPFGTRETSGSMVTSDTSDDDALLSEFSEMHAGQRVVSSTAESDKFGQDEDPAMLMPGQREAPGSWHKPAALPELEHAAPITKYSSDLKEQAGELSRDSIAYAGVQTGGQSTMRLPLGRKQLHNQNHGKDSSGETSRTTCSTAPTEAMEEDERLCHGII